MIGLFWDPPQNKGGAKSVKYRVFKKEEGSQAYTIVDDDISDPKYTVTRLTPGKYYHFKVETKNQFGYSTTRSEDIKLLCAWTPYSPDQVKTRNINTEVLITWNPARNGGATVTSYKIYIINYE